MDGDAQDRWYCHVAASVVALARGSLDEAVSHAEAATEVRPARGDPVGVAALVAAYTGDLTEARRRNDEALRLATSPSMRSWGAYVAGEIETVAGRYDLAQQRYTEAIDEARSCGAAFLIGVANVGLVAARGRDAPPSDALPGYLETIDYFARTGNLTHLWTTLRNLAELLERLGDGPASTAIISAADRAPEAPAVVAAGSLPRAHATADTHGRDGVLAIALDAIGRHLG